MSSHLSYRPDIDGLRALAVIPVIFFHIIGPPVSGGFAGVDIFFVISGYLITSIILKDCRSGSFSLLRFYERRVRRIFPALFTVLAVTLAAGFFLLFPPDLQYFGQTLAATAVFASNVLFWRQSGYFETDSLQVPLLHTWSLGVEEQFYIFFPLVLILAYRFFKSSLPLLTVIGAVFSFALALYLEQKGSHAALFYLLPTRAWELLAGSFLAYGVLPPVKNILVAHILSIAGFLLTFHAFFGLDETAAFPGAPALFPVIGALCLIYAGSGGQGLSVFLLGQKAPVLIGKISYSLYLWHWPVIVFLLYAWPLEKNVVWIAGVLSVCLILSYLSWRFVEQPFRCQEKFSRRQIFFMGITVSLMAVLTGVSLYYAQGLPGRFPADVNTYYKVDIGRNFSQIDPKISIQGYNFVLGDPEAPVSFLVWGDSHAMAASPALEILAKEQKIKGYLLGTHRCLPSFTNQPYAEGKCNNTNANISNFLSAHSDIKKVILVAYWSSYKDLTQNLSSLVQELARQGRDIVIVTEIPPAPVDNVALYLARASYYHLEVSPKSDLTIHEKRQLPVRTLLNSLQASYNFKVVDPAPAFCPHGICPISQDGRSLYYDDNHLSTYGAETHPEIFSPVFSP